MPLNDANPDREPSRARRAALLLVLLAAMRLFMAGAVFPMLVDAWPEWAWENNDGYDRIALHWVHTGVFSLDPGVPTAQRMPLYPLVNAAAYRVAGDAAPAWVRLAQALLSVWTGILLFRLARAWAGPKTAAWALALFVFHPHANTMVFRCATETLFSFLVMGWLYHLARYGATPRRYSLVLSGVYLGLAFLTRPSLGFLPLLLYPWTLRSAHRQGRPWKRACADVFLAGLIAGALTAPWLGRNARATGHFPVFQTWVGHPLYQGTTVSERLPEALRGQVSITELDAAGLAAVRHRTHAWRDRKADPDLHPIRAEWEADRFARKLALERWGANPWGTGIRWARNLFVTPFLQMTGRSTVVLLAWNGPLLALALWGWIHTLWRRPERWWAALPWTLTFFYFLAVHALVWPQARYLLPALTPFTLFAAERLARLCSKKDPHVLGRG